jgi:hypothetical protein
MPSSSDGSASAFARLMALAEREGGLSGDVLMDASWDDLDDRDRAALDRATLEWPRERVLLQLGLDAPPETTLGAAARAWMAAHPPGWTVLRRESPRPREHVGGARIVTRFASPARGAFELPSGEVVAWGGKDVVMTGSANETARWVHQDDVVGSVALPGGSVVSFAYDGSLAHWRPGLGPPDRGSTGGDPIVDVLVWPGQGLVAVSSIGEMFLWRPDVADPMLFSSECDGDAAWRHTGVVVVDGELVSFVSNDLIIRRYHDDLEADRLTGHTDIVVGVAALDGGRVVTWSDDRTLRVWDVRKRAAVSVLTGHTAAVTGAVAAHDGRIVSWASDRTVRSWRADGMLDATFEHPVRVSRAAPLPDGGIATLADDGIRAWVGLAKAHFCPVARPLALRVTGDQVVAFAAEDPALHVMTTSTGASSVVVAHAETVLGIEGTRRGLLSWSKDGAVLDWQGTVAMGADPAASRGAVRDLALFSGGVVTAHATGRTCMTDLVSGRVTWSADEPDVDGIVEFDQNHVLSWSTRAVNVRRLDDGELIARRTDEPCGPTIVSGAIVLTRSRLAGVRTASIWQPRKSTVLATLEAADGWSGARWLPDGDALLWSDEGRIVRWQRASSTLRRVDTSGLTVIDVVALAGWTAAVTDEGALLRIDGDVATEVLPVSAAIEGAVASPRGELVAWSAIGVFHVLAASEPGSLAIQQGRGHRPAWVAGGGDGAVAIESDGTARYVSAQHSIAIPDVPVKIHSVAATADGAALVVVRDGAIDLHRAVDGAHVGRWQSDAPLHVHGVTLDRRAIVATSRGEVFAVQLPPPG